MHANLSTVHRGMNLRNALRVARCLGVTVTHYTSTGEFRVAIPDRPPLRISARRKDAARCLTTALRQIAVGGAR